MTNKNDTPLNRKHKMICPFYVGGTFDGEPLEMVQGTDYTNTGYRLVWISTGRGPTTTTFGFMCYQSLTPRQGLLKLQIQYGIEMEQPDVYETLVRLLTNDPHPMTTTRAVGGVGAGFNAFREIGMKLRDASTIVVTPTGVVQARPSGKSHGGTLYDRHIVVLHAPTELSYVWCARGGKINEAILHLLAYYRQPFTVPFETLLSRFPTAHFDTGELVC